MSSGVEAADGHVIVGNAKGQLFAFRSGNWQAKMDDAINGCTSSPSLNRAGRVISVSNDGTVFAHDLATGQQVWTYNLQMYNFSLHQQRGACPVDARTVLISSANAYVYALDVLSSRVPTYAAPCGCIGW